jgi:aspartyl-tRNA(Asn)/glutamyl-tRNA(Gln) amidotransferase subunit A
VTTYGSILFAEHVPTRTAEAVRLLESAGYANVGKTNLHEFAYGISSQNPHFGTVPNPVAPGRLAGGSSGGSAAALAAGLADVALGSDSGGSIRIPGGWCGVVGFKPTWGLVSLEGCFPLASSFDHAGPMARTVGECEEAMRVLAPGFEPHEVELDDVRAGFAWTERADPLLRARVEEAIARFPGAQAIELPDVTPTYPLFMREVADVHRELFSEHSESYGENVRPKIERCLAVGDAEAETASRVREELRAAYLEATEDVDVLLTPTVPMVAPPADADELGFRERGISLTYPFNCLGWPALALPCGPAEDGLPASLQVVGKPGADAFVLGVGASLVRGTPAA